MAFQDKHWVEIKKNGYKLELTIKDQDWKKVATIRCNSKDFPQVLSDVERRFGIQTKVNLSKELKKQVAEELGFLKKELDW